LCRGIHSHPEQETTVKKAPYCGAFFTRIVGYRIDNFQQRVYYKQKSMDHEGAEG
jgi:hypothetical protein